MSSWEQSAEPIVVVEPSASGHVIGVAPHPFGSALLQTWRIGTVRSPRAISRSGWFLGRVIPGCSRAAIASMARPSSPQMPCSARATSHWRLTLPESAIAPAGGTPSSCMP
jgi:hypothetical protein